MYPANTVAVTYYFSSLRNTRMSFTWYWQTDTDLTPLTQVQMDTLADDAFTQLAALWQPLGDDDSVCLGAQLVWQADAITQRYGLSTSASVAGTFVLVDALPDNMALVIRKRTDLTGPENRGRVFIPCISEGAVNDGFLEAGAPTAAAKALADYFGADAVFGGTTFHSRHWNRKDALLKVITVALAVSRLYSKIKRLRREYGALIH